VDSVTSFLSVVALVSIVVAHKLDPFADLPMVRPVVTVAITTSAIVSLLAPDAAGVGSAWLIDRYVADATELTAWITERVFENNPMLGPSSPTTTTP
jgi:hypothetical protein